MIFCILGASNSGKTELLNEFVKAGSQRIRTTTTRPQRVGEPNDAYDFISLEEFEKKVVTGELIEHVTYGGNNYGLTREAVVSVENGVIVMEPNGFRQLCVLYPNSVYSILLRVSPEERRRRGVARGDDIVTLNKRICADESIFSEALANEVNCVFNAPERKAYPLIASLCRAPF